MNERSTTNVTDDVRSDRTFRLRSPVDDRKHCDVTPTRLPLLSNSSLNTFRRCPREYYFRYVLLRKTRAKAAALRFGTLFHVALNAWWARSGNALENMLAAIEAINAHVARPEDESDAFEIVKARCLIVGYSARWGAEGYETLAVEKQFRVPIGGTPDHGYDIGGAIDVIVRRGGRTRNVEHKTTSADISVGSDYWRHVVTMDPQVSTYMHAAQAIGYDPHDTLYDVIRKPTLVPALATPEESKKYTKPTKSEPIARLYKGQRENDETPEEYETRLTIDIAGRPGWYYARAPIVRLPQDTEAHAQDLLDTSAAITFATTRGRWPRSPNACERYGRLCEYHDACSGVTTIEDDSRFVTKEYQHEELKQ